MVKSKPMPEVCEFGLVQVQIVNYKRDDLTLACLESIRRQTYTQIRIVLLDNATTAESQARLRMAVQGHIDDALIANAENLGWGAAHNIGFQHNESGRIPEFFLVVNNDAVLDRNCLEELVQTMRFDNSCAIASPMIYKDASRSKVDNVGFNLSYRWFLPMDWGYVLGNHRPYFAAGNRKVTWSDDTVALMRRGPVLEAQGYDEEYFMYVDETDLVYRLRQKGHAVRVCYKAIAYHSGKGSSQGEVSVFSLHCKFRNWHRFHRKHFSAWHQPYVWLWLSAMFVLKSFQLLSKGNFTVWRKWVTKLCSSEGVKP